MNDCIIIFATAWGTRYGGINSFNYDLCCSLAKLLVEQNNLEIVCIVEEGESQDIANAKLFGVSLLVIPKHPDSTIDTVNVSLQIRGSQINPVCVLGHDLHTGQRAIDISKNFKAPVAVFHHMDYRAYKSFQDGGDRETIRSQESILRNAHIVFAIGPKLEDSAKDKIRGSKKTRVVKVQPGLAEIEPLDTLPSQFSAITFGRVNKENSLLKQTNLAVASFGVAAGNPANPLKPDESIWVLGLSEAQRVNEYQLLKELIQEYAKKAVPIYGWSYDENRESLFDELRRHSVCMMLSIHDGFGLVGLEAISAGVPLILSKNTGLYQAIASPVAKGGLGIVYPYPVDISGSYDETLPEADIEQVVKHLYEIASRDNREEAKRKAIELKRTLSELWTWENLAQQIFSEIQSAIPRTDSRNPPQPLETIKLDELSNLINRIMNSLQLAKHIFSQESVLPSDCDTVKNSLSEVKQNIQLILDYINSNSSLSENVISVQEPLSIKQFYLYQKIDNLKLNLSKFRGVCQDDEVTMVTIRQKLQRSLDDLINDLSMLINDSGNKQ